jgi:hypothetical protein
MPTPTDIALATDMRSFFVFYTAMSFVVMGADYYNAYTSTPSPTQMASIQIDDGYAD